MYYKEDAGGGILGTVLVLVVIFAACFIGDAIFAEQVAQREVIQFMGYDDGFFVVTISEEGETRFNVDFRMYKRLEVGQEVFVSYRVGKLSKYKHKIMETN